MKGAIKMGVGIVFMVSLVLSLFLVPETISSPVNWWNSSFGKCMNISIDNVGSTTLTDFPAYINLTYDSDMLANYNDLRFVDEGCGYGGNLVAHEIENYTTKDADIWLRVTSLPSTGTNYSVYYANTTTVNSAENMTGVWRKDYVLVYHMQETDIDGGAGDIKDSTFYANHGTTYNMDTSDDVPAMVDGGFDFDGSADYMLDGSDAELDIETGNVTVEMWLNTDELARGEMFEKGSDSANAGITFNHVGSKLYFYKTDGAGIVIAQTYTLNNSAWHYVVGMKNSSTIGNIYYDGILNKTGTLDADFDDSDYSVKIGDRSVGTGQYYDGIMDELRISNVSRSADWINQTYTLIAKQSTHVYFGTEETESADGAPTVTLISPANNLFTNQNNVTFNCSATDDIGFGNITLWHNETSIWVKNQTKSLTGKSGYAEYYPGALPDGSIGWTCMATDNISQTDFPAANWTVNIDTVDPNGVNTLTNTTHASNYITWTWNNDSTVYKFEISENNGTFTANTSAMTYNATSLSSLTCYQIEIYTWDRAGNRNDTIYFDYACTSAAYEPFGHYVDHMGNPVLKASASEAWDDTDIHYPALLNISDTWYLMYMGATDSGETWDLGMANSTDLTTWSKYDSNPTGTRASLWCNRWLALPSFVWNGTNYLSYYEGLTGTTYGHGYSWNATDDLGTWSHRNSSVLNSSVSGWDEDRVGAPAVCKVGSTYHKWYHGLTLTTSAYQIGYANSTDGITWTKYSGNPVISNKAGTYTSTHAAEPRVICHNDTWFELWVSGDTGGVWTVGYFNLTIPWDNSTYVEDSDNPRLDATNAGWSVGDIGGGGVVCKDNNNVCYLASSGWTDSGQRPEIGLHLFFRNRNKNYHGDGFNQTIYSNSNHTYYWGSNDVYLANFSAIPNQSAVNLEIKNFTSYSAEWNLTNTSTNVTVDIVIGGVTAGTNYVIWHGNDKLRNITANASGWLSFTYQGGFSSTENFIMNMTVAADSTSPTLDFVSPTLANTTVTANDWIYVNVSANEALDSCLLDWNGTNESMTVVNDYCYINKTDLSVGVFYFRVWGNDSVGNLNNTYDREITYYIDYIITITHPTNKTYYTFDIVLNGTINLPTIMLKFNINNGTNHSITCVSCTIFSINIRSYVFDEYNFLEVWGYNGSIWNHSSVGFTTISACNSTYPSSTRCGGDGERYVLTCKQYGKETYQWDMQNMTWCEEGCIAGQCRHILPRCQDGCSLGDILCFNDKIYNCANVTEGGCLDWDENNITKCLYGCYEGGCLNETSYCNYGDSKCLGNKIIWCDDDNSDGFYEWSAYNITKCEFGCIANYTTGAFRCSSSPDTGLWNAFGMAQYIGRGVDYIFNTLRLKFILSIVAVIGVIVVFGKVNWQFGIMSGIMVMFLIGIWIPEFFIVALLVTMIGGAIIMYMKAGGEENNEEYLS